MLGLSPSETLKLINEIRIWSMIGTGVLAVITMVSGVAQIRLQSVVGAAKDAELERYKADAVERTQALKNDASKLQIELEKERSERLRLENKVKPRRLSHIDKGELGLILSGIDKVNFEVDSMLNDAETHRLALDFVEVLKSQGLYEYDTCNQFSFTKVPSEVRIHINEGDLKNRPVMDCASALCRFLVTKGLSSDLRYFYGPQTSTGCVNIRVGHKPA